jgi:superfamily I DNA and/or RNA helicase
LETRLTEVSERLWNLWLRIQPSRLFGDRRQRQLIGDFKVLLEQISQAREANKKVSGAVYRRFYELFTKLAAVLPAWAVTNLSARGRIPLDAGFFDLLVVDEASQCDIASPIPLLYRCKRAVIIGDPKQLPHITQISPSVNQQLMHDHKIEELGERWSYKESHLYRIAEDSTDIGSVIELRDHHRSRSEIIEFSNRYFYEGRLRVATRESELRVPKGEPALRWVNVSGTVRRPPAGGAANREEAEAVVKELERILVRQSYDGSVGVVSPFRAQANLILDLVNQNDRLQTAFDSNDLLIQTAYSFQGDQRDVMVFSPVVSRNTPETAIGFLRSNPNTFNVAITRARAALIVVGDHSACKQSSVEHLSAFANYVANSERTTSPEPSPSMDLGPEYPGVAKPEQVSDWERLFYREMYRSGIRCVPQYQVEKYALDFALIMGERRLNIEIEGEHHRSWNGELALRDQMRNRRLIELGWDVM